MKRGLVIEKKGLSTLVTSLILILLVLVAVGILYSVYINFIKEGVGDISMGKFTINLEVQSVVVNDDGTVDINVKRNPGEGVLTGIKFLISDGVETIIIDELTTMQELGSKTFNLDYESLGFVKEVSIAPIVTTSSGKESVGNVADKFEDTQLNNLIFSNNLVSDPLFTIDSKWSNPTRWDRELVTLDSGDVVSSAKITTTGDVAVVSDFIQVDPYKTYRFSIWVKSDDSVIGTRYLGHYAYNSAKAQISSYNSAGSASTNYYFWYGDIPAGTWKKVTGYIFACDTLSGWTNPSDTTLTNYRMDCNTKYLRMRFLNYYNYGTSVTNWFALPRVEEV